MHKKLLKFVSGLLVILAILFLATYFYVTSHKEEVANFIANTISENHGGTVSFEDMTMKSWGRFSNPAFHITNMVLLDSTENKIARLEIEDAYVNIFVKSLLKNQIQVKSVEINTAKYTAITKKETFSDSIYEKETQLPKTKSPEPFAPFKMDLDIEDFVVDIQNVPRNKAIQFKLKKVSSIVNFEQDKITSSMDLEAAVEQLGFNLEKGSYLKDSRVSGSMNPVIDLKSNNIHIPTFDLSINDQVFKLTADFNTTNKGSFVFKIENEHTEYLPTMNLVSENIQQKLSNYVVDKTFYTNTILEGSFAPFSNPLVHIEFNAHDNSAKIADRYTLDSIAFDGSFKNRIYEDDRSKTEDKKNLKLIFNTISGKYKETAFEIRDGLLKSTPETKAYIEAALNAQGKAENLISILDDPIFSLRDGSFNFVADIKGDAGTVAEFLASSEMELNVSKTSLIDHENKITIPVDELKLHLEKDIAVLDIMKLQMTSGDKLIIEGQAGPFSALLSGESKNLVSSNLNFRSNKLDWKDFLEIFDDPQKNNREKTKDPQFVLHDIFKKIYQKFNPDIDIAIKKFQYETLVLDNFSTDLSFSDVNNLHLTNMGFDIPSGKVKLVADLNYEKDEEILVNADFDASGGAVFLNDLFNNDTFLFKSGRFDLIADITGNLMQLESLILEAKSSINLYNGSVFYKPMDLIVPIDLLDVEIIDNRAILNSLEITVGSEDKLNFSGELDDLLALISSNSKNQVNSSLLLHSDKLQWDDFLQVFAHDSEKHISQKKDAESRLKETLRGIYSDFNPRIGISIDKFQYKDFMTLENFKTGLHYRDVNNLVLEESGFNFNSNAQADFSAQLDISKPGETLVNIDFEVKADPSQLNDILNYDTFLLEGGSLKLTANINGDIEEMNELISSSSSKFIIENSSLIHNTSQTKIPFSILEIDIENDDAILKTLKIDLPSGDQLEFSGELDNITSIIPQNNSNSTGMSSKLNIYSKKLSFDDFLELFSTKDTVARKKVTNRNLALKIAVKDFYKKYQPELSIYIDEFVFNKLIVKNFNTGFYFENKDLLYLENTGFDFYKGKVNLDAHLDIADPVKTAFSIGFTTDNLDLEKLLTSFDYFNIPSIKEADKIAGKVSINTQIEGDLIDSTGIISNSIKGTIGFDLEEMEIKGFDPIIKLGNIVFKKKRLEDIRFGSIKNVLYVANNTVEFPLMEVKSTAFDFFVEGHLGFEEVPTNLWTGIPLSNFKSRDLNNIPKKTGYVEAGKKIYIEAKSDKKNNIKYKLHLSERQYFKERSILSAYRTQMKEDRLLRRKYKRDKRKNEKLALPDAGKTN
jgi:virulence-associated protein VapD